MADKSKLKVWRGSEPANRYTWSPFVIKIEARLRFAKIPYDLGGGSPKAAPRGKIPYVTLENGSQLGDTTFIIKHLTEESVLPDLNKMLSPMQKTQDLALRALMEDKLYFHTGKEKWCDNYVTMREGVLAAIPWPIRYFIGILAYRAVTQMLHSQGTLRLDDEELKILKEEAWESINTVLEEARKSKGTGSEQPFWALGGEKPTEVDATMYGFVVGALICEAAPETMRIAKSYPAVVEYARRIHDRYFPDYERWAD